jgi:perosamine synthetase
VSAITFPWWKILRSPSAAITKDSIQAPSGKLGILSFNGNKTITTGGGGMIITNDDELGPLAKYITTTAKKPHPWKFEHDMIGFNYRLPNVNAALGCAQMGKAQ